jgi:hypothetical protein
MMHISIGSAEILKELGFKQKAVEPGDFYEIGNQEWVVGGQVSPEQHAIIPPAIPKKGTWLPSAVDLLNWLEQNTESLTIRYVKKDVDVFYLEALINGMPITAREQI